MNRRLLCTDLDGTLIPNGLAAESPGARELFQIVAARSEVTLVYVTGRHLQLIDTAIGEYNLPRPAFAIGDVGTTIYQESSERWLVLEEWQDRLTPDWPTAAVTKLKKRLANVDGLELQEPSKQNRFKVSYYARPDSDDHAIIKTAGEYACECGLEVNLVWSVAPVSGHAMLDILPARANKLTAIVHLMGRLGFSVSDTVFAGDSGNDTDVFRSSIPSIVVANADHAVKQLAHDLNTPQIYVATGRLPGMNGNYSAGVLEGACHFWPEVQEWIQHGLSRLDPHRA